MLPPVTNDPTGHTQASDVVGYDVAVRHQGAPGGIKHLGSLLA